MSENNKEIDDAQLASFKGDTKTRKFTSNIIIIIIVFLFIGLIFIINKFGENFFIFFMFAVILLIPVFIIFKNQFLELLPDYFKKTFTSLEADEQRQVVDMKIRMPNIVKEIMQYVMAGLFLLGGAVLIYLIKKELKIKVEFVNDKDIELADISKLRSKNLFKKIIGSFLCIAIGGIIILDTKK